MNQVIIISNTILKLSYREMIQCCFLTITNCALFFKMKSAYSKVNPPKTVLNKHISSCYPPFSYISLDFYLKLLINITDLYQKLILILMHINNIENDTVS